MTSVQNSQVGCDSYVTSMEDLCFGKQKKTKQQQQQQQKNKNKQTNKQTNKQKTPLKSVQ